MFSSEGLASFCSGNAETGFRLVYNIELYFRLMIRWELVGNSAENWRSNLGELNKEARRRQTQEAELRLIDTDSRNLLDYLLLTEIKDLMVTTAVWPLFKDRWPPQDMFQSDFKWFNALRNKVAHFRTLTDRDLRMLDRFKDTVVDVTASYRRQKRGAKPLDPASLEGVSEGVRASVSQWAADCATHDGRWRFLSAKRIGKYLVLDTQLRVGSFAPDAVVRIVDAASCDAFFLCIDEPEGRVRIYLPVRLGDAVGQRLVDALYAFPTVDDSPLDDDEDVVGRFDFVMPYEVELPMDFRV